MWAQADLEASHSGRGEGVLEGAGEGIQHNPLAGGFGEVRGQVAQQDGGVGPDGRLLIYLQCIRVLRVHEAVTMPQLRALQQAWLLSVHVHEELAMPQPEHCVRPGCSA